ncbi:MAG: RNA polymerase sigma factor, partial [Candidatus Brocadiia bacterium]
MNNEIEIVGLVRQARLGDSKSMDRLAEAVGIRLRGYIYRSTLNRELTEDLCQEALLEMMSSIGSLEKADSFWPWIFRIASSKIVQHYRHIKREAAIRFGTLEDSLLESILTDGSEGSSVAAIRGELGQMIVESVSKLNGHQRSVVALRCYEGMSFAEIADSVGCREVDARVSFFRAKQFLKKQLSNRGFSRSSLLMALLLFGKMTAPSQAAAAGVTLSKVVLSGVGAVAVLRYHRGKILA